MEIGALGRVRVEIKADTKLLEAGLAEARRKTQSFDKDAASALGGARRAALGFGQDASKAGAAAKAANDNVAGSAARAALAYDVLSARVSRIGAIVGSLIGLLASSVFVAFADAWSDINARVGLAVGNMDASGQVMARLADVARRTYSNLELTAESFIENAGALKELGYSTAQQLDYTESLNNALVVSGARGERAEQVQRALSKAMALGKLSGDELNTVLSSGGRVAEVLAAQLGVGVNSLRGLGAQGKLTGDLIYTALVSRLEQLRAEAESMPATIGDAFTLIRNSLLQLVGTVDQTTGISAAVAAALISIADGIDALRAGFEWVVLNLDKVTEAASIAGVALGIAFGPAMLAQVVALFSAIYKGLAAVTAMLMANPLGL